MVDRHWVEAEGGGAVGRVPSSVLIKTELPNHPAGSPLFVAAADFQSGQPGDLGFARGLLLYCLLLVNVYQLSM